MAGDRTKEYEKGFEQGQKSPRGFVESIMDGLGEVVPHPSSDEYRSWEKGRDAGEKWRSENPYPKEENETGSSFGDGGGYSGGEGGGSGQGSSSSRSSSDDSSSSSGLILAVGKLIFVAIFVGVLFNFIQGTGSKDRPIQLDTPVNNQQREAPIVPKPSTQEEAPRQEPTQAPSEKVVKPERTVRNFRFTMNSTIAAANDFTAEVHLADGSTEPASIAELTKGSETLYVTLAQDYPEGTMVTIYPKIEYFNRFVVPANPGILTSPDVKVILQLPDGSSLEPCVENIERRMSQLVVTTCDNYPTGTRVIVTPVYGGYRRY